MTETTKVGGMGSRERIAWMQKRQDEQKLSQILYQGQLISLEADIYKHQLGQVRKLKHYDSSTGNLLRSQSNVHLPPIKPIGDPQTKNFLNELRNRDYKKYLESLKIVKGNQEQRNHNEFVKSKLFRLKFKHFNDFTKEKSHQQWDKLESIAKLYPEGLEWRTGGALTSRQGQKPKQVSVHQAGPMTERAGAAPQQPVPVQKPATNAPMQPLPKPAAAEPRAVKKPEGKGGEDEF